MPSMDGASKAGFASHTLLNTRGDSSLWVPRPLWQSGIASDPLQRVLAGIHKDAARPHRYGGLSPPLPLLARDQLKRHDEIERIPNQALCDSARLELPERVAPDLEFLDEILCPSALRRQVA